MQPVKRIPYGIADYRRMKLDNMYYVDKTRFIPQIEAAPYYLFLIRPRRFGKTLWLSLRQFTTTSTPKRGGQRRAFSGAGRRGGGANARVTLKGAVLVYHGWELVYREEVSRDW